MTPNDFGSFNLIESCRKISVNTLVRQVKRDTKQWLIANQPEVSGLKIKLCESQTGFGGSRLWFSCPTCTKRVGMLYQNPLGLFGCRACLGLKYKKSRFKGMAECKI